MNRQIIQQLRMAGRIGAHPEVARGFDERGSEVVHPHPIDHDPSDQRLIGLGQPSGQSLPPLFVSDSLGRLPRKKWALVGTSLADVIYSLGGNDLVQSNGGTDVIYTGSGEEVP
jgi:hypothetical protein